MSIYNKFAGVYDELMDNFNYKTWENYIEKIFLKYNKKPQNILEMACGTGSLTYELAKNDYNVTAFDISEEMLAIAQNKLMLNRKVNFLNLDMINFNISKKYDAVISICDSINYILEEEDLEKVFLNAYNHLEENGIFIFDINSSYKLKQIIGNNIFIEDRGDIYYTWSNQYNEDIDICDFFLTFFIKEDSSDKYIRFNEEHSQKAYEIQTILNKLRKVGFQKIDYYEGFTFNEVKKDTQRINFIAIK